VELQAGAEIPSAGSGQALRPAKDAGLRMTMKLHNYPEWPCSIHINVKYLHIGDYTCVQILTLTTA
jgi:hypothetical protein